MNAKTSLAFLTAAFLTAALLTGVAVCVLALGARPASACDVDGIHAAASAQAQQAFSVGGTASSLSSSFMTLGATPLASPNPVIGSEYGRPPVVRAREVASPNGIEGSPLREDSAGEIMVGKLELVRSPIDDPGPMMSMAVRALAWWSRYLQLTDTTSSSDVLLQPASLTPKSD